MATTERNVDPAVATVGAGVDPDAETRQVEVVQPTEQLRAVTSDPAERPAPDAPGGAGAVWQGWIDSARRAVRGIRGRVVVSYVVLVAAALALSLLVVRQVLLVRLDRQIEESLAQEVSELRRTVESADPSTGQPIGTDAGVVFDTFLARNVPSSGEVIITLLDGAPYLSTRGGPRDLTRDAELVRRWSTATEPIRLDVGEGVDEARTLAVPLLDQDGAPRGVFVVAVFPDELRSEVDQAVRVFAGVGLVVTAIAAAVATALAGRVLRPVTELTETAARVGDNDLTVRFDGQGDDELARLGAAFNSMLDRLEAGFDAQREVLDDVAHELRTPITIVRGHLELLEHDPAERDATVELCLDELDRMGRYVNELLLVASASRPDFLRRGPIDVGEFAEGLFARVRALADRDWLLVGAPPPGTCVIDGDADRLTQAIVNLASNAVQHTADGDLIVLEVQLRRDHVALSVRDRGPGVPPELAEQLFTRFSRGAGSRSTRPEGTGLGLAIVAAVAHAHGGDVTLDAPDGGGARFTITVPLVEDAPAGERS